MAYSWPWLVHLTRRKQKRFFHKGVSVHIKRKDIREDESTSIIIVQLSLQTATESIWTY